MTPDELGQALVTYLQGWLHAFKEQDAAIQRWWDQAEADGLRVVAGGRVSRRENGVAGYEYTDARTGDVLASESASDAFEEWPDGWIHVDRLDDDVPPAEHVPDATLPPPVRDFLASLAPICEELGADGIRTLLGDAAD